MILLYMIITMRGTVYFVALPAANSTFSRQLAEHNKNKLQLQILLKIIC